MSSERAAYATVLRDLYAKKAEILSAISAIEALMPAEVQIGGKPIRPAPEPRRASAPTIVDGAMEILKREGKPTHVSELVRQLAAMGVKMDSADRENTVGSILNRRRRKKGDVVRVSRGTWALDEHPFDFDMSEVDLGGDDDPSGLLAD